MKNKKKKKVKKQKIIITPLLEDLPIFGSERNAIGAIIEIKYEMTSGNSFTINASQFHEVDFIPFLKAVCEKLGWKINFVEERDKK